MLIEANLYQGVDKRTGGYGRGEFEEGGDEVIIYCNSDCKHSPTGICQRRNGLLMLWTRHKKGKYFYKTVICDDYTPVKKVKGV